MSPQQFVPRDIVLQPLTTFSLSVLATPTALSLNQALIDAYIDSMLIQVISTAGESVFLGDGSVTAASGIEIQVGLSLTLVVNNTRQLYELQYPALDIAAAMKCEAIEGARIPVVVWDPSQVFLIAAVGPVDCRIALFKNPYV